MRRWPTALSLPGLAASIVASRAARLGLTVFAGRVLVPADFGSLVLVLTVLGLAQTVVESGVDTVFTRFAVAQNRSGVAWFSAAWTLKTVLAGVIGLLLSVGLLLTEFGPVLVASFILVLLTTSWSNLAAASRRITGDLNRVSASNYLRSIVLLLAMLLVLSIRNTTTVSFVLALLVSEVAALAVIVPSPAFLRAIRTEDVMLIGRGAVVVGLSSIVASSYTRLAPLVLAALARDQLAVFGAASRFVEASQLLPAVATWLGLPLFCALVGTRRLRQTATAFISGSVAAGAATALLVLVWGDPLMSLAYGGRYPDATRPLATMAGLIVLLFINPVLTSVLYAQDRARVVVAITFANLAVGAVAMAVFVPSLGALGASLAWTLIEALNCALHVGALRSTLSRRVSLALLVVAVFSLASSVSASVASNGATLGIAIWLVVALVAIWCVWTQRDLLALIRTTAFELRRRAEFGGSSVGA